MWYPTLEREKSDDQRFLDRVSEIVAGVATLHPSPYVRIHKIDNWFDHKWLEFSGVVMTQVGYWNKHLTVPPFHPNRIAKRWQFVRTEQTGEYELSENSPDIHYAGPSGNNLHRMVQQIAPLTSVFWLSGNSALSGRASLMAYVPIENDWWPWFVSFSRESNWEIIRRKQIHDYEIRRLLDAAAPAKR